ncbi:hypothetical protein NC652_030108 [Populus alba x Populus x berolinensis]|nr:hypothetical protein NC652_030108 [Populus alba x Populus x berolinensis]
MLAASTSQTNISNKLKDEPNGGSEVGKFGKVRAQI